MAGKSNIGTGIVLDGEREFKKALADINAGLRVTASELALVTAKYSDNATSVKALTDKGVVLESKISSQTEKIAKLREALAASAKSYGESDAKTMKWQTSLNNAETELVKMESELKDNNTQLQQAQKNMQKLGLAEDEVAEKTSSFGDKLGGIIEGLGIHLPAGADKAIKSLDGTKAATAALIGITTGLISGLANLTIQTAKTADEILTLADVTGLSSDTIQELKYASEFVDVSLDTMTSSMSKMIRTMGEAQKGSKEAKDAFHELHLSITDNGHLKDSEEMFYEIVDALGKMRNETERDALAMKIFGRSAQELNPLIKAGSDALKKYAEQAQVLGYVLSPETLAYFENLDNSMKQFSFQLTAVGGILAQAFLPPLTVLFSILNGINPKVIAIAAILGTIGITAFTVIKGIVSMAAAWQAYTVSATTASAATAAASTTTAAFQAISLKTVVIITAIIAGLAAIVAIIAVLAGKAPEVERSLNSVTGGIARATQPLNNLQGAVGRNATGTSSWRGGWTWVGEQGPELINPPAGSRILNNRQSMNIVQDAQNSGRGDTYIFQPGSVVIDAKNVKDFNDVVQNVKGQRQTNRAGRVAMA